MKRFLLPEEIRIQENHIKTLSIWDKWGPYVSERAWGTVRENYGNTKNAWHYLSHDMARSYAYHWGEDGIAAICDRYQTVVFSLALWNHKDPILKERLFGLVPEEGNHGEDVKEAYFYLDNTPSHSYMKYLYKYPQDRFPYEELTSENKKRSLLDPEFEIYDTKIFDDNRYWDIVVEYVKVNYEDIMIRLEIINRSSEKASLDVLPQICFRNTWSENKNSSKPKLWKGENSLLYSSIELDDLSSCVFPFLDIDYKLGKRYLYASTASELLFTENETNLERLNWGKNPSPYVKDAFHRYVIQGDPCIRKENFGTKGAFYYKNIELAPHASKVLYLRLSNIELEDPLTNIDSFCRERKKESDDFYASIAPSKATVEEREIQKMALSGLLWNRELYLFPLRTWLERGDRVDQKGRQNGHWQHLLSKHVISMPDKWEYPWFAAWDLAFHAISIALFDIELAKDQLWLLLTEQFQHPNGQIPAYEWEFSDLNPPVQAWALWKIYQMEMEKRGRGDETFLKKCFHKLVINFVWWVNREDLLGNNIFEGGFLGLDNIGVIDRSEPIHGGGVIEQSDGTGWMGIFCLNLMRIALELAKDDTSYEMMGVKFFQHFLFIHRALVNTDTRKAQNWNEEEGFFYDVICHSNQHHEQMKVRSLVGIIPIFGFDWMPKRDLERLEEFWEHVSWFKENRPDLVSDAISEEDRKGEKLVLFSLAGMKRTKRVLEKAVDPEEFFSPFGLRSLSKVHDKKPYTLFGKAIQYAPGEGESKMYGGNSNWRGPVWMPINYLFIQTLKAMDQALGEKFIVNKKTLGEWQKLFSEAIINLFKKNQGKRIVHGPYKVFEKEDWKDLLLFYEYFHGEKGWGLGASHQTGWTALVANLIHDLRQ